MTTHLPVNHYGCTYYYINEDSYIYMGSLIMKDKEKKRPLELSLCYLSFFFPLFILYNRKYLKYLILKKK